MARIPIALQLYSVREECAKDLPGVLSAVADMGYEGVEFAGYHGYNAPALKKMLDERGLQVAGAHLSLDVLLEPEFERTVEFHKTLGNRFLIVSGFAKERTDSRAAWLDNAQVMNEVSERLRPHDMRTGYHNHWIEFEPLDGELPWDTFFSNTKPEIVMQFDTGNAMHGGAEAPPFLERYPGRAATVHLKEYSAGNDKALIGEGDVPWDEIFRLCETSGGTQWYIVEQESYAYPPLECVARCLQKLKQMGK